MNKNRIRGLPGRTSERVIAKSRAIKGREGKSGGDAAKAVGLIWPKGSLRCVCPYNMNDNILYHTRSTPPPAAPRQAIMPDRSLTYSRVGAPPVPAQPAWFHRLDEILSALRNWEGLV